jgi:hypothetical protein
VLISFSLIAIEKQYVTWLNNEALELGGRLHYPSPLWWVSLPTTPPECTWGPNLTYHRIREAFVYYTQLEWEKASYSDSWIVLAKELILYAQDYMSMENFTRFDVLPANEWSKSDYLWDVLAMEDAFW